MTASDEFIVTTGEKSKRLDVFLANRQLLCSRSAIQRLIREGQVRINGQAMRASYKIKPGDRITLDIPKPEPLDLKPEAICLEVLYEDEENVGAGQAGRTGRPSFLRQLVGDAGERALASL